LLNLARNAIAFPAIASGLCSKIDIFVLSRRDFLSLLASELPRLQFASFAHTASAVLR
jgi:hypothetical protein